jgi:hypothetical protein
MNCNDVSSLLPNYLEATLEAAGREEFEGHAAACESCRQLLTLWDRLGELPEPVPSAELRRRFEEAVERETSPPPRVIALEAARRRWPRRSWPGWAAAAVLLAAASWTAGRYTAPRGGAPDTAALAEEVRGLRSLVAVSLLGQHSASDRLRGIHYADAITAGTPEVIDALVHAVRFDSNVNVRLAACEALRPHANEARVRRALIEALAGEESPLAKISLIEALSGQPDRDSARAIARLATASGEDSLVQRRAWRMLEQMQKKGITWE